MSEVNLILPQNTPKTIKGPLAGDKPIYVYISPKNDFLLYSENLKKLLSHHKVKTPLEVSDEGISFLLQSGFIPTPKTAFKNLFVLNIGDKVVINFKNNKFELLFSHSYPFFHSFRNRDLKPDIKIIFKLLINSVKKRIKTLTPIYFFHSAGKDSNIIALALSFSDLKPLVTCLTLKGYNGKDESEIAKNLAQKIGLKHKILHLPPHISSEHIELLINYFKNIVLPCVDGVSLAYPFYTLEVDFKNSNIIDGSGSDIYMGHIPRKIEYLRQKIYSCFKFLRPFSDQLSTENLFQKITLTRCERVGAYGLTYKDTKKIYPKALWVFPYWEKEDNKRKDWDYFDIKGDIWGPNIEFDRVMRKVRNFAEVYSCNLIFPWTDEEIATYFAKLPERYLFDRKTFKNKLILRKILKDFLDLDCDKIGKFSYPFDAFGLLMKMEDHIKDEIFSCKLWNRKEIEKLYKSFLEKINKNKKYRRLKSLIVRLYLISAWFNHSKFVLR